MDEVVSMWGERGRSRSRWVFVKKKRSSLRRATSCRSFGDRIWGFWAIIGMYMDGFIESVRNSSQRSRIRLRFSCVQSSWVFSVVHRFLPSRPYSWRPFTWFKSIILIKNVKKKKERWDSFKKLFIVVLNNLYVFYLLNFGIFYKETRRSSLCIPSEGILLV